MQINKTSFVKELVYGKSQGMPYAENRSECIGPEAQVGYLPKKFQAVFLWLKRKLFRIAEAEDFHPDRFELHLLAFTRRSDQLAGRPDRTAGGYLFQQIFVKKTQLQHHLQVFIAGSVVKGDKLIVPQGPDPTHNRYFPMPCGHCERIFDFNTFVEHSAVLS
jgi:hypothetical protein